MPNCATSSSSLRRVDNSSPSATHPCLPQNPETYRCSTDDSERSFQTWRAGWMERAAGLALRLTHVEARLSALAELLPSRPVLSLVGNGPAFADSDEGTLAW